MSFDCGCQMADIRLTDIFTNYQRNAKRRGLEFNLSREEFRGITQENCFYCGCEPKQVRKRPNLSGCFTYNGIDKIDNTLGYIEGNYVPCCGVCNRAKDVMSQEDFLNHIERIYKNVIKKEILI